MLSLISVHLTATGHSCPRDDWYDFGPIHLGMEGLTAYNMLDWSSTKQRIISHSSNGTEVLACAEADYRGFYMRWCVLFITIDKLVKSIIVVDSKGLYDTIRKFQNWK